MCFYNTPSTRKNHKIHLEGRARRVPLEPVPERVVRVRVVLAPREAVVELVVRLRLVEGEARGIVDPRQRARVGVGREDPIELFTATSCEQAARRTRCYNCSH